MENNPLHTAPSNDPNYMRKRKDNNDLKERRREDSFVNKYVQIKHPEIYKQIKAAYENLKDRYPGRPDLTKTYYFKKWEKDNMSTTNQPIQLYVPHLPVLTNISNSVNTHVEERRCQQGTQQTPQQEITQPPSSPQQEIIQPPSSPQQEISQPPSSPQQEITHPPPSPQQEIPQPPQPLESTNLFPDMTLDQLDIAAEEIINSLQDDTELMNMIGNFNLPENIWDNELSLPDYILEQDLEW